MSALNVRRPRRRAFTLIELLVVIVIVGVLASILIPVVATVRASAQSTHCMSNLQQLGRAFTLYAQENRSLLPPPMDMSDGSPKPWYVAIHAYTGTPWIDSGNASLQLAPVFSCPSWLLNDHAVAVNDIGYSMSAALGMNVAPTRAVPISSVQSPTRTVLLLEQTGTSRPYFPESGSLAEFATGYGSAFSADGCDRHGGAANYLFVDGHVGHHTPNDAMPLLR